MIRRFIDASTNARTGPGFVLTADSGISSWGSQESKDVKMGTIDIILSVLGLALVGLLVIKFKGG